MSRIGIIVGTNRPNRFGIQPAQWIAQLAKDYTEAEFVFLDLQEIALPFLDEPTPPLYQNYTQEHTKKWAQTINDLDGFVVVTGEYNHGVPAVLKNAIDFAAKEWNYKPIAFVSYGAEAGGTRAVEQLRQIVAWLRMYDLSEQVYIPNYWTQLGEDGMFKPSESQIELAHKMLKSIIFWSKELQAPRKKLQKSEA